MAISRTETAPTGVEGLDQTVVTLTITKPVASYNIGEVAAFLPDQAQALIDRGVAVAGDAATAPPVNIDIPYAAQENDVITCTMGNWTAEPTSYSYQWQNDGTDVGDGTAPYAIAAGDAGHTFVCIVTATNANGSTAAPASNAVIVTEPATRTGNGRRRR